MPNNEHGAYSIRCDIIDSSNLKHTLAFVLYIFNYIVWCAHEQYGFRIGTSFSVIVRYFAIGPSPIESRKNYPFSTIPDSAM